jgi:hypothetical protein
MTLLCAVASLAAVRPRQRPKPPARPAAPTAPRPSPVLHGPTDEPPIDPQPISQAGLVGWWRGDGNADDDTKTNPGATTGGVTYAPAMVGRGFRFTGRDDAVRVADSPTLALTGSMTISAWINVDEFSTAGEDKGMILFRGDDRPGLDPYGLWVGADNRVTFHIESTERAENLSAPIAGRRFVLVTAMLDASTSTMRIYENTVLVAQMRTPVRPFADLDPGQHSGIGIGNCNSVPDTGYRYPFHGVINDLRLYRRLLAPAELHALYAQALSVPSPLPADQSPTR